MDAIRKTAPAVVFGMYDFFSAGILKIISCWTFWKVLNFRVLEKCFNFKVVYNSCETKLYDQSRMWNEVLLEHSRRGTEASSTVKSVKNW